MKKLMLITALAALAGCDSVTHPATSHECDSLNLTPGTQAYSDCMHRMKSEEAPLHNAQDAQ